MADLFRVRLRHLFLCGLLSAGPSPPAHGDSWKDVAVPEAGGTLVYDSRTDDPRDVTRKFLNAGDDTLRVAMYKFTDRRMAGWIKDLLKDGVVIEMILDAGAAAEEQDRPWAPLVSRGLRLRFWPAGVSELHAKFVLSDHAVLTGSANWTPGGMRNNVEVMLWNRTPSVVASFKDLFGALWEGSHPIATDQGP